jgi:transcriptional regulator with XRE-family HTH domain
MANAEQIKLRFVKMVRERMRVLNLTQKDVAQRIDVSPSLISLWLNTSRDAKWRVKVPALPSIERKKLLALADALRLPAADLFNVLGQAVVLPPGKYAPEVQELANLAVNLSEEQLEDLIALAQLYKTRSGSSRPPQSDGEAGGISWVRSINC